MADQKVTPLEAFSTMFNRSFTPGKMLYIFLGDPLEVHTGYMRFRCPHCKHVALSYREEYGSSPNGIVKCFRCNYYCMDAFWTVCNIVCRGHVANALVFAGAFYRISNGFFKHLKEERTTPDEDIIAELSS